MEKWKILSAKWKKKVENGNLASSWLVPGDHHPTPPAALQRTRSPRVRMLERKGQAVVDGGNAHTVVFRFIHADEPVVVASIYK